MIDLNRLRKLLLLIVILSAAAAAYAHEAHNKNAPVSNANTVSAPDEVTPGQAVPTPPPGIQTETSAQSMTEFPTLHPLIVHFPIMLIILAAVFQIVSMFVFRREMSWVVIFMTAFGALGAYLSSSVFHPHTAGLNENAQRLLTEHELYADWTLWMSLIGLVAKAISNFVLSRRWWSESVATVSLILAAIAVGIAGHHGAELVHKEGVGPKGQFLEMHDH